MGLEMRQEKLEMMREVKETAEMDPRYGSVPYGEVKETEAMGSGGKEAHDTGGEEGGEKEVEREVLPSTSCLLETLSSDIMGHCRARVVEPSNLALQGLSVAIMKHCAKAALVALRGSWEEARPRLELAHVAHRTACQGLDLGDPSKLKELEIMTPTLAFILNLSFKSEPKPD